MFCLNHRSIKVTLFSEIHIKIISKISLTYHQIAFLRVKNIYIVANVCLHVKKAVEFLWSRQKLFIKKSNV